VIKHFSNIILIKTSLFERYQIIAHPPTTLRFATTTNTLTSTPFVKALRLSLEDLSHDNGLDVAQENFYITLAVISDDGVGRDGPTNSIMIKSLSVRHVSEIDHSKFPIIQNRRYIIIIMVLLL